MDFVIPCKGVYESVTLSPPLEGETINISGFVEDFRYEQRPPDEDGTSNDIIVLGGRDLVRQSSNTIYSFHTTFDSDLPSVRHLTFLPFSESRHSYQHKTLHSPESFLPTEPITIEVGVLERAVGESPKYTVVLQVL